jgi:2'-5' RNA ligase
MEEAYHPSDGGDERTRTFVAVHPDEAAVAAIAELLALLQAIEGRAIRWLRAEQVHVTLRFLGDCDAAQVAAAGEALARVAAATRGFDLAPEGIGAFPNWRRPRVLWLGAGEGGAALESLAHSLEEAFREAGLGSADKPFRAHLTLGRVRERGTLSPASAATFEAMRTVIPVFRVGTVRLMASRLTPAGAVHRPIAAARLGT